MTLTCQHCRTPFDSPLRSRYCPLCRRFLVRAVIGLPCEFCAGALWCCSDHNATPFDQCCGAPIVACVCNPDMRSPPGWHVVSDPCMGIAP